MLLIKRITIRIPNQQYYLYHHHYGCPQIAPNRPYYYHHHCCPQIPPEFFHRNQLIGASITTRPGYYLTQIPHPFLKSKQKQQARKRGRNRVINLKVLLSVDQSVILSLDERICCYTSPRVSSRTHGAGDEIVAV